jgi:hypothetical protein
MFVNRNRGRPSAAGTCFALAGEHQEEVMDRHHQLADLSRFKRQQCSACACEEKFNFHVPDEIWNKVVVEAYRNKIVCLSCFDRFARERGVDDADSINELYFAGDNRPLSSG